MEHGHFLVIPPHFDGNNHAYWKVRMKAFLKSIDERVWNSVEYGWEKPTTPISEWQTPQKEAAALNSKAMNAIFNAVSMEEFKRISNVEVTHTAWNILHIVHEGTKAVKINKLQQLTFKFESIRMSDDLLMNSVLNLMILLILHITWVKSMINLKLLGRFLDL